MAVFTAASDETASADGKGNFFTGGFVAPTTDWVNYFAPAWEECVLNRKPMIPFLHMADIRSKGWRAKHGLTDYEAEYRVDEACRIIGSMGSLILITASVNESHFKSLFSGKELLRHNTLQPAVSPFYPDVITHLTFWFAVLKYAEEVDAEKVDFIVERKEGVTPLLEDMFARLPENCREVGFPQWAGRIGEMLPVKKDRVPVQAADVACWHVQRAHRDELSRTDYRRMAKIASRIGKHLEWRDEWTEEMAAKAKKNTVPSPFKPKNKPRKVG